MKLATAVALAIQTTAPMASALQTRLEAIDGASSDSAQQLRALLTGEGPNDGESVKVKESALTRLCEVLVSSKDADALSSLLLDLRPLFAVIPKAKTAKIIRTVIDAISRVPNSTQRLVSPRMWQSSLCNFAA